jgi:hypothetical protein
MVGRRGKTWVAVAAGLGIALVATGCSGDEGGGTVAATLQEFAIAANPSSIAAGEVTFEAENIGPDDLHELVVIRTDLTPDALPTNADGSVDEGGEGVEAIGEIEEFPVGETQSMTLDLDAGSYVLICNIYDADEQEAHYQEGMRLAFTVE